MPDYCDCDNPTEPDTHVDGTPVICLSCGKQFVCQFAYLGGCAPTDGATVIHIDYRTCDAHERNAVDNVASREM